MRIRSTPSARLQFLEELQYIKLDDPSAARRFRERAETVLSRLIDHPASGLSLPEFPGLPHREVIVRPYRFFYRIAAETVWIVGVWHDRRIPEKPVQ